MSDPFTQRNQGRGLEQTRVIERAGATGFDTFSASGVWTPAFIGTTIAGAFTYIAGGQMGVYTRISNQVFIHAFIGISAIPTPPKIGVTRRRTAAPYVASAR